MRSALPATAVCLVLAHPACAQGSTTLATGSAPEVPWLRLVLSLLLCIGIAVAAILLLRRYQRGGTGTATKWFSAQGLVPDQRIRIVEARRLGAGSQLCLVRFDDREMLLAVTSDRVAVLAESPCDGESAPAEPGP